MLVGTHRVYVTTESLVNVTKKHTEKSQEFPDLRHPLFLFRKPSWGKAPLSPENCPPSAMEALQVENHPVCRRPRSAGPAQLRHTRNEWISCHQRLQRSRCAGQIRCRRD